jgi:multiple sugar transport system substrate-binding protein
LNDFIQSKTAMAIDSSVLARDISDPDAPRSQAAAFAAFPYIERRTAVPAMSHWQACIHAKSQKKLTAFLFLLWATSKPTSLRTAAAELATTGVSAWSSEAFKGALASKRPRRHCGRWTN